MSVDPKQLGELANTHATKVIAELREHGVGVGLLILITAKGEVGFAVGLPSAQLQAAFDIAIASVRASEAAARG